LIISWIIGQNVAITHGRSLQLTIFDGFQKGHFKALKNIEKLGPNIVHRLIFTPGMK
jgi:hypothetical protein